MFLFVFRFLFYDQRLAREQQKPQFCLMSRLLFCDLTLNKRSRTDGGDGGEGGAGGWGPYQFNLYSLSHGWISRDPGCQTGRCGDSTVHRTINVFFYCHLVVNFETDLGTVLPEVPL